MNFSQLARLCFADGVQLVQKSVQTVKQESSDKNEKTSEKHEERKIDLTPILDKTQLFTMGETDLELPEFLFKDLQVESDEDKELVVAGIEDLSVLWKICAAVCRRKEWTINKVDIDLYTKLLDEVKQRSKEHLYVLFTLSDQSGHAYVFWMVNPTFIEGRFTCKVQEETYGTDYTVTNTSVIAVEHEEDSNPGDYSLEPIIEEFAKEDKSITEEAQTLIENAEAEAETSEEEDWGSDEFEEDVFAEDEEGDTGEEDTNTEEDSGEAEPKNFSYFRAFFQ